MNEIKLNITLLSDTTFGRGEGTAGEVDTEVEHDEYGIPFIGGKTIRGLLRDSWLSMRPSLRGLQDAGDRVFGPTSCFDDRCILRIGDAVLEPNVRRWLVAAATRDNDPFSSTMILSACTDIRYQTAEERETAAPANTTLRASRVVLRGFVFEASLAWLNNYVPNEEDNAVLAAASLATRHGGLLRNRGRGHLCISLNGDPAYTKSLLSSITAGGKE